MYIDFKLNDEAKGVSLEEFEKEYETFYGYIMIKLGNYKLGCADKKYPGDEGDDDISYYIKNLIKCGITLLLGQQFRVQLLDHNLLEIHVYWDINVNIEVVNTETRKKECSYKISFRDLKNEIDKNFKKYINDVNIKNPNLLGAKTIKKAVLYFDIFNKLYENHPISKM